MKKYFRFIDGSIYVTTEKVQYDSKGISYPTNGDYDSTTTMNYNIVEGFTFNRNHVICSWTGEAKSAAHR